MVRCGDGAARGAERGAERIAGARPPTRPPLRAAWASIGVNATAAASITPIAGLAHCGAAICTEVARGAMEFGARDVGVVNATESIETANIVYQGSGSAQISYSCMASFKPFLFHITLSAISSYVQAGNRPKTTIDVASTQPCGGSRHRYTSALEPIRGDVEILRVAAPRHRR